MKDKKKKKSLSEYLETAPEAKTTEEYKEILGEDGYQDTYNMIEGIIKRMLALEGSITVESFYREYLRELAQRGEIEYGEIDEVMEKNRGEYEQIAGEWFPDDFEFSRETHGPCILQDHASDDAVGEAYATQNAAGSYMANASVSYTFFTRVAKCFNIFEPPKNKRAKNIPKPASRAWETDAQDALTEAFGRLQIHDDDFIAEMIDAINDGDNIGELKSYRKYRNAIRERGKNRINAELIKNGFGIADAAFAELKNNRRALEYAHAFYCNAVFRFIEDISEGSTDTQRGRTLLKITAFAQKYASYLDSYIRRKMALESFSEVAYAPYGSELHDAIREHRHWTDINEISKGITVQNSKGYTKDWITGLISGVIMRYSPLISIRDPEIPPLINTETRGDLLDEYRGVIDGSVIWSEIRGQSAQKALRFIELIETQLEQVAGAGRPKIFFSTEILARASIDLSRAVIIEKAKAGRIPKAVYSSIFRTMDSLYAYLMDSLAGTVARPSFTFDIDSAISHSLDDYLTALKKEIEQIAARQRNPTVRFFKREQHRVAAFNLVIERIRGQLAFIEKLDVSSDAVNLAVGTLKKEFDDSMLQYLGYIDDPELMDDPLPELRSFLEDPELDACINNADADMKSRLRLIIRKLSNLADLYRLVRGLPQNSGGPPTPSYGDRSVFYAAYVLSTMKKMLRGKVPSPERIRKIKSPPVRTNSSAPNIQHRNADQIDPNVCTFDKLRGRRYYTSNERTQFSKMKPFTPISDAEGRQKLLKWVRRAQRQINKYLSGDLDRDGLVYSLKNKARDVEHAVDHIKTGVNAVKDIHYHFIKTGRADLAEVLVGNDYRNAAKRIKKYIFSIDGTDSRSEQTWYRQLRESENLIPILSAYGKDRQLGLATESAKIGHYLTLCEELDKRADKINNTALQNAISNGNAVALKRFLDGEPLPSGSRFTINKRTTAYQYYKNNFMVADAHGQLFTDGKFKRALNIFNTYKESKNQIVNVDVNYKGRILTPPEMGSYNCHQIHLFEPKNADEDYEMVNLIKILSMDGGPSLVISPHFRISKDKPGVFGAIIDEIKRYASVQQEDGGNHYLFKNYHTCYGKTGERAENRLLSDFSFVLRDGGRLDLIILTKLPQMGASKSDGGYKLGIGSDPGMRKHSIVARAINEIAPVYGVGEFPPENAEEYLWADGHRPSAWAISMGTEDADQPGIQELVNDLNAAIKTLKAKIERVRASAVGLQSDIDSALAEPGFGCGGVRSLRVRIARRVLRKLLMHRSAQTKMANLHKTVTREIYTCTKKCVVRAKELYEHMHGIPADSIRAIIPLEDNRSLGPTDGSRSHKRLLSEMERGESRKLISNYFSATRDMCITASARYSSTRCATCGCFVEKGFIGAGSAVLRFSKSRSGNFARCSNPDCSSRIVFDTLLAIRSGDPRFRQIAAAIPDSDWRVDPDMLMAAEDPLCRTAGFFLCRDRNAAQNFARYIAGQPQLYIRLRILATYIHKGADPEKIEGMVRQIEELVEQIKSRINAASLSTGESRFSAAFFRKEQRHSLLKMDTLLDNVHAYADDPDVYVNNREAIGHYKPKEIFLGLAAFDPPP